MLYYVQVYMLGIVSNLIPTFLKIIFLFFMILSMLCLYPCCFEISFITYIYLGVDLFHSFSLALLEGEKVEAVTGFIFLGSKITKDGDCSHYVKRCLLLVRKAMTNLDKILKSRDHHIANKDPYSQSHAFFFLFFFQ